MINQAKIKKAIKLLLEGLGENPNSKRLKDTPQRVSRFYKEFIELKTKRPEEILKTYHEEEYNEIVILKDIPFYSICEHHLLPFFGKAHIAYLPSKGKLVGISKLVRILDYYSKNLQLQERLTQQIADTINKVVSPQGLIVIMEAEHLCMSMRGVKKQGSQITTSAIRGIFLKDHKSRSEVLSLLGKK